MSATCKDECLGELIAACSSDVRADANGRKKGLVQFCCDSSIAFCCDQFTSGPIQVGTASNSCPTTLPAQCFTHVESNQQATFLAIGFDKATCEKAHAMWLKNVAVHFCGLLRTLLRISDVMHMGALAK